MNYKRIFLICVLFVLSAINYSSGQTIKTFSKTPELFLKELSDMFDAATSKEQKDEGKALMLSFSAAWNQNKFTQDVKDSIYALCNVMAKKKMKTFPNFEQYLKAELSNSSNPLSETSYNKWHVSLRKLAQMSNNIRFIALLDASNLLLSKNMLYQSQLISWKTTSNEYQFDYDSLPYFEFQTMNLICTYKNDSSVIYETSGRLYPTTDQWAGTDGKIYWDRCKLSHDEVFAEVKKPYIISLSKADYKIDSVNFYNTKYFQRPLFGYLQEKVIADVSEERISYPRFTSFENKLEIKNLYKDVDYEGGFAQHGPKLIGKGDDNEHAHLYFFNNNKRFVKLSSKAFIINKDEIGSDYTSVVIYLDQDSITHPGLKMKFTNDNRELSLLRIGEGLAKSPYFNTYHKIDMYFEALYWKLDQPKIEFGFLKGTSNNSPALFESDNYYSEFRWEKLRGLDDVHPLSVLKKLADQTGSKMLYESDIVKVMHVAREQVQALLLTFAEKGFIIYYLEDGKVLLKDRVYNYINSKIGKTDYDVIQFNSVITAQNNATLNLLNYDIKIRGVARVFLSDSQSVYVDPYEQEITLKKNRNFEFDGKIHAGLFDYYGKKFVFNYDKFKFDMEMIDSMSFKVQDRSLPTDIYGHHPLVKVRTVIENLNGELAIDHPNNKSGLKPFPTFPSFVSKKDAYVYYDKPFIFDKVYKRDKFYYRLQPFRIDSLDSYDSEKKQFNGYLVSAGIFPDITEPLTVQPDYSLGFVIKTPTDGLPAYSGKGRFDSIVDLSYKGFLGKGILKYSNSVTKSNEFVFFPDSLWAIAKQYNVKEKSGSIEFPAVYAEDVLVKWYPYYDHMYVQQRSKPFDLFNSKAILHGGLDLNNQGLNASGKMIFGKAEMTSNKYALKNNSFKADTARVKFKTSDLNDVVLQTDNFNVAIDFTKQLGKFKANDEDSKISFPFNQFACNQYNFDWLMNKDQLLFESALKKDLAYLSTKNYKELISENLTKSQFISEHPGQKSLAFYAPDASYNLNDNIIYAKNVPIIFVADAAIYPDSGKITILKKAEILPLKNCKILANTETQHHFIYDANATIVSKNKFSGSGTYDYVDELDNKEKIMLSSIAVDTAGHTYAFGEIPRKDNFKLNPFFDFYGKASIYAEKEAINFDGGTRIKHECDTLYRKWLRFTADVDPKNIEIPVGEKPLEYVNGSTGGELGMGLFMGSDSTLVYPSFLNTKKKYNDAEIISAQGFLTYDKALQRYYISPKIDSSKIGVDPYNYVYLDKKDCKFVGSGAIDLGANLGRVSLKTYGNAENNMVTGTTSFDLSMALDFFFEKDAFQMLVKSIQLNAGLDPADPASDKYYNAMKFMVGTKKADELMSQLNLSGKFKSMPEALRHSFVFSDVKFTWNPKSRSFVSEGKIGIASSDDAQLNKYVTGYIEIARKKGGNILNMYIETGDDWYYFSYQANKMQSISSKKEYNELIRKAMESEKNLLKAEDKQPQYVFFISTNSRKEAFLNKIGTEDEDENTND